MDVKNAFPSAVRICIAGRCPCCKTYALVSFTLEGLDFGDPPNPRYEYCGYYCQYCDWSNAGDRIKPNESYPNYQYKSALGNISPGKKSGN